MVIIDENSPLYYFDDLLLYLQHKDDTILIYSIIFGEYTLQDSIFINRILLNHHNIFMNKSINIPTPLNSIKNHIKFVTKQQLDGIINAKNSNNS